jgi:hypothetical protein
MAMIEKRTRPFRQERGACNKSDSYRIAGLPNGHYLTNPRRKRRVHGRIAVARRELINGQLDRGYQAYSKCVCTSDSFCYLDPCRQRFVCRDNLRDRGAFMASKEFGEIGARFQAKLPRAKRLSEPQLLNL